MSTVIKVENLCKRYYLSHKNRERFPTLRDAIMDTASNMGKRLLHPLRASSGQPLEGLDSTEEFWALDDVSFEVKQGDRIGIIGRNGAGKSTLLKILSRITEPTRGRVSIKGRVASLLEVGTGFHPELTGRENIFLNGAVLGMSRVDIKRRFDEIVAFSEVEKFLDTPVKRYSSGMYVRLAFAVAAHLEPEILIIDEVLAVGDAQFQSKCINKMKQVSSQGRTVVFVSHNMGVIGSFCSRSLLLEAGQIEAQGETTEIVKGYQAGSHKVLIGAAELTKRFEWLEKKKFILERVKLISKGQQVNVLQMGDGLRLDIDYTLKSPSSFLKMGVQIADSMGNVVAVLSPNQQCPDFVSRMKKRGTISCSIESVNFTPGEYSLNLHAEILGDEPLYILDGAASFSVLEKDVYGTGVIPSNVHGITYFLADWTF